MWGNGTGAKSEEEEKEKDYRTCTLDHAGAVRPSGAASYRVILRDKAVRKRQRSRQVHEEQSAHDGGSPWAPELP